MEDSTWNSFWLFHFLVSLELFVNYDSIFDITKLPLPLWRYSLCPQLPCCITRYCIHSLSLTPGNSCYITDTPLGSSWSRICVFVWYLWKSVTPGNLHHSVLKSHWGWVFNDDHVAVGVFGKAKTNLPNNDAQFFKKAGVKVSTMCYEATIVRLTRVSFWCLS